MCLTYPSTCLCCCSPCSSGTLYAMTKAALNQVRTQIWGHARTGHAYLPGVPTHRPLRLGQSLYMLLTFISTVIENRHPLPVSTLQLTKNLACEWASSSIRVNTVAPWYTATDLALQVLKVRVLGCV